MAVETLFIGPFAAAYVAWLLWQGTGDFGHHGAAHAWLMTTAGIATVIPLLCFGAAAIRVTMVTIGLLQYIAPILQFLIGVFWYGEAMPASRWIGFTLVWIALMVFTVDAVHHRRRQLKLSAEAVAL
jgi:chloramphenicol-sensitive protein RarD